MSLRELAEKALLKATNDSTIEKSKWSKEHPNCFSLEAKVRVNNNTTSSIVLIKCEGHDNNLRIGLSLQPQSISPIDNISGIRIKDGKSGVTKSPFRYYYIVSQQDIHTIINNAVRPYLDSINATRQHSTGGLKISYSRQETQSYLANFENASGLYKMNFVNWRSKTNDTHEYYTEILAQMLLSDDRQKWLRQIRTITRRSSYFVDHTVTTRGDSNRIEPIMAIEALTSPNLATPNLKFIDHQVPLNNRRNDGCGKIDLIAYDSENKTLRLFELKNPDEYIGNNYPETLLRCVLEIFTYFKIANHQKMIRDFKASKTINERGLEATSVTAHVLVAKDSIQHQNMIKGNPYYHPNIVQLMKKLGVGAYVYEYKKTDDGKPSITKIEPITLD